MIALRTIFIICTTVIATILSQNNDCLVDVIFVIDGSSSINGAQFQSMLNYVDQLTSMLSIRPNAHRIALLEYSGRNRIIREYGFDTFTSVDHFRELLLNLPQMRGTTFTARALEQALVLLDGRRPGARSVVVTVTDGFTFDDTTSVVAKIAALGTQLFAFNVNEPYNEQELIILANGVTENVFHLPNAVEDAQLSLGPYLQCADIGTDSPYTPASPSSPSPPPPTSNCPPPTASNQGDVDETMKKALIDFRDIKEINAKEAIVLFTNGFACDYPGQYANSLRDQETAVHVVPLNNAESDMTVTSISSQMLMETDIHALLALIREQYCKLQGSLKASSTTIGYSS